MKAGMVGNLQSWNQTQKSKPQQKELVLITQHRLAGGSNTLWDILELLQHPAQLGCESQRTSPCSHAGKAAQRMQLDAHQAPAAPQLQAHSATKAKNQLCAWIRDTRTPLSPSQGHSRPHTTPPANSGTVWCWEVFWSLGSSQSQGELPKNQNTPRIQDRAQIYHHHLLREQKLPSFKQKKSKGCLYICILMAFIEHLDHTHTNF